AAAQYAGWPRVITQIDNYNPQSWGELGEMTFDVEDPVVQLVDRDSKAVLYTVRASGKRFTPRAPRGRSFVIKAGRDAADEVVLEQAVVGGPAQVIKLR
ncbi:MAG: hypothetical protein CMJ88_11035, partial [Planctomycetes bacterium]|nr:hypothetical protein [Planctomycetota bacterium]